MYNYYDFFKYIAMHLLNIYDITLIKIENQIREIEVFNKPELSIKEVCIIFRHVGNNKKCIIYCYNINNEIFYYKAKYNKINIKTKKEYCSTECKVLYHPYNLISYSVNKKDKRTKFNNLYKLVQEYN